MMVPEPKHAVVGTTETVLLPHNDARVALWIRNLRGGTLSFGYDHHPVLGFGVTLEPGESFLTDFNHACCHEIRAIASKTTDVALQEWECLHE